MILVIYIGLKLTLYLLWCRYGIRLLTPLRSAPLTRVLGLALARISLGLALGYGWVLLLTHLVPSDEYSRLGFDPFAFLAGLFVLRWVAWSGVSLLIRWPGRIALMGTGWPDRLWRLGGMAISFLGDFFVLAGLVGVGGMIC